MESYRVDHVGRYLQRIGVDAWLVEVGGELKAYGRKPDGTPWRVGIERPDTVAGGRGERCRRTGPHDSTRHEVASVSVLANDCMQADPLGTTLSVPGAERGMAYARKHGLAVLMIVRTRQGFEQRMSPAFAAELQR